MFELGLGPEATTMKRGDLADTGRSSPIAIGDHSELGESLRPAQRSAGVDHA